MRSGLKEIAENWRAALETALLVFDTFGLRIAAIAPGRAEESRKAKERLNVSLPFHLLLVLVELPLGIVALINRMASSHNQRSEKADCSRRQISILGCLIFLFIDERSREHIVGDLEEEYLTIILPNRTYFKARFWWWREALGIVAPYIWKRLRRVMGLEVIRGWRRH